MADTCGTQTTEPLPPYIFGGSGPVIHLAHANGFPPQTYLPLVEALMRQAPVGYRVIGLPARPLWPGSRPDSAPGWRHLVDDLVDGLDRLGLNDIAGVGHSLGGVLTMWAAIRRPDLFRAVVLIDPVMLPPAQLWTLRCLRRLGLRQWQPLVREALRRRRVWPSRPACYRHFQDKPLFTRWTEASLRAYVESGTRERPDGQMELVYPPEWEAHLFATVPVGVWKDVAQLHTATLVVRGERSDVFGPASQARMGKLLPGIRFSVVPGATHMVPMECPQEVAGEIHTFLRRNTGRRADQP